MMFFQRTGGWELAPSTNRGKSPSGSWNAMEPMTRLMYGWRRSESRSWNLSLETSISWRHDCVWTDNDAPIFVGSIPIRTDILVLPADPPGTQEKWDRWLAR